MQPPCGGSKNTDAMDGFFDGFCIQFKEFSCKKIPRIKSCFNLNQEPIVKAFIESGLYL